MNLISTILNFLFLLQSALGSFLLQGNFTNTLNQQFSNLSQFEGISSSAEKSRQMKNAMSALLNVTAPKITKSPGYRMPFEVNCSVFFDKQIEKIICDTNFEDVQRIRVSCSIDQEFPANYMGLLHKNHILQTRTLVDLDPVQQPQATYWLYFKLQPTLTLSKTETNSLSWGQTTTPSDSELVTASIKTASKTSSNTLTHSDSRTATPTASHSDSTTPTLSISQTPTPSSTYNVTATLTLLQSLTNSLTNSSTTTQSELSSASLSQSMYPTISASPSPKTTDSRSLTQSPYPICSMDIYADRTNQPARYLVMGDVPNSTVTDLWTGLVWEQVVSDTPMTWSLAQTYCGSLSKGGYSDWRLPSVTEIQSLVDYAKEASGAIIEDTAFPSTPPNATWTSTANAGIGGYAWDLEFARGQIASDSQGHSKIVRCVRGISLNPVNRYTDQNGYVLTNQSTQVRDVVTGLTWERTPPTSYVTWSAAQAYCQGLTLGAASWRLPTIKELTSLIDYNSYSPAINLTVFPVPTSNWFWASTPSVGTPAVGWIATFVYHGLVQYNDAVADINHARCVQDSVWASEAYVDATNQTGRYVIAGNGTDTVVTDTYTGLMWEQTPTPTSMIWDAAADYCAGLTKNNNYGCWRLPTPLELRSLADFTRVNPAIDTAVFPNTPNGWFWTSTPVVNDSQHIWVLHSGYGMIVQGPRTASYNVRCARGNIANQIHYTTENGDELTNLSTQVKNQATGLIWQRSKAGTTLVWNNTAVVGSAQSYCRNLVIGTHGAGSWRLPSIKELTTLIDYSVSNPSVNIMVFGPLPGRCWTSTPNIYYNRDVYLENLASGGDEHSPNDIDGANDVRCILNTSAPVNNGIWSPLAYEDATNQTARYYVSGTSPNAIVTDDFTGLMWEQQVSGTTHVWNASAPAGSAQAYCAGLTKGGYTDWRLPTPIELQSLIAYTNTNPAIASSVFPGVTNAHFWASPALVAVQGYAWVGYSGSGYIGADLVNTNNSVRCVHSIVRPINNRYSDVNGNPLSFSDLQVKDDVTGFVWQRAHAMNQMNWSMQRQEGSAQYYCKNLVIENHGAGSWRLPTAKELFTIGDFSSDTPSTNTTVFPASPAANSAFWTNSFTPNSAYAWGIHLGGQGTVNSRLLSDLGYVRCILNASAPANNGMWSPLAYQDATNQTARYYVSGTSPNAIVTDDFTGLMWEQQVSGSTYFWNASAPAGSAQAHCASLTKGGYVDWRLPTPQELQSLVEYAQSGTPTINPSAFSATPNNPYWTSQVGVSPQLANRVWHLNFNNDGALLVNGGIGSTLFDVRCVRRATLNDVSDRYLDQDEKFLTNFSIQAKDVVTGLIWQRAMASFLLPWNSSVELNSAQGYCRNLVLGDRGAGSWRLPTVKELVSLSDFAHCRPSINITAFPGVTAPNYAFWASSPTAGRFRTAWYVEFEYGGADHWYMNIDTPLSVRCIFNASAPANNGRWSSLAYQDATNQTARYYVSGTSPNAIVTDDFTGLMWEQQVSPSTYFWNSSAPPGSAQAYCASLTKGGYADWRLPTPIELQTLVDYTHSNSSINAVAFPDTLSSYYWSSTPYASSQGIAWYLHFFNGGIDYQLDEYGYHARCVRSRIPDSTSRYTDEKGFPLTNSSQQVKDAATGLIWQRGNSDLKTWSVNAGSGTAQAYCNELSINNELAGSWRLPSVKELSGLLNVTVSIGATINLDAFPNTPIGRFWSSTRSELSAGDVWAVLFDGGSVRYYTPGTLYVRCVRP